MNLLELAVKIGVDDQTDSGLRSVSSKAIAKGVAIGNAMWDVTKQVGSAAAGAVKSIAGGAFEAYASYEQLAGGVEKLFGDASATVMANANSAWKSIGMNANDYMQQATTFSAALINSLGGDTQAAAAQVDVAMKAMADNISIFGSSAEDVQNAFNGFAKQNYTMLDNLKLGYGGTKEEMERLIDDANAWGAANGEASDLSIDSFSDVVTAIQQIQEKQGIAGNAAGEAAGTVEGSINSLKAAWDNLIAGLGKSDANIGELTDNLVGQLGNVVDNVAPVAGRIVGTLVGELPGFIAEAASAIPGMLGTFADAVGGSVDSYLTEALDIDTGPVKAKLQEVHDAAANAFSGLDASGGQRFLEGMQDAGESLRDLFGSIDASGFFDSIARGVQNFLNLIAPAGDLLRSAFDDPDVQQALQTLADVLGVIGEVLITVVGAAITAVAAVITAAIEVIATAINAVSAFVGALVQFFGTDVPGAFTAFVTFFQELPGKVAGFLASVIATVVGWVAGMAQGALDAGSQFLANVVSFLAQLPGSVLGFLSSVISTVVGWVAGMAGNATQAGSQFLANVVSFLAQLPGSVAAFLASVLASLASWVTSMGQKGRDAGQSFLDAIRGKMSEAVDFVRGIPGKILGALGNVGGLLYNAGRSIIDGFLSGLKASWGGVTDFVSGIADWISAHKGPIDYDRVLLVPAGHAIMEGLAGGLRTGFERDVVPYVASMADRIAGSLDVGVPVSVPMEAAPGGEGAPSRDTAAIVAAIADLAGHIDGLELTIDGNRLVGAISDGTDRALGRARRMSARGVMA